MLKPSRLRRLLQAGEYTDLVLAIRRAAEAGTVRITIGRGEWLGAEYLDSVAREKTVAEGLLWLGTELWGKSHDLEAIAVFEHAARLGQVDAASNAGQALHWMQAFERSVEYLRMAIENGAENSSWLQGLLGEALSDMGELHEAVLVLEPAYADHPEFGVRLARVLMLLGQLDRARDILRTLCEQKVYGAPILLGNLRSSQGEYDEAVRAYHQDIDESDAHSAYNLGLLYRELGNTAAAASALELARVMGDRTLPPEP